MQYTLPQFSARSNNNGRSTTRKSSFFGWSNRGLNSANSNSSTSFLSKTPEPSYPSFPDDSESYPNISPQRSLGASSRHSRSLSSTQADSALRRSVSVNPSSVSGSSSVASRKNSDAMNGLVGVTSLIQSPEKGPLGSTPTLFIPTFGRKSSKTADGSRSNTAGANSPFDRSPLSATEAKSSVGMQAIPLRPSGPPPPRPTGTSHSNAGFNQGNGVVLAPAATITPSTNGQNPNAMFQHIHDLASKRVSTLDYLRKAHDGRVYWFNTLLFAKPDLTRLPSSDPRKLARRATNYLILGFSLPTVLDLNSQSPLEYLRALNALLLEFDAYQTAHPPDGSAPSSLTRRALPNMFKRANPLGVGKGRRSSSVTAELGLSGLTGSSNGSTSALDISASDISLSTDNDLLPGEEYTLLLTPSLPFDPDFFETFATLCDVLIDCYTKVMELAGTPELCTSAVVDLFNKADQKVRKIIVAGVVREFEDASRQGVKGEMAGVGKVVLGGLM